MLRIIGLFRINESYIENMVENENIVCLANTTWDGFYTKSTVQIMSLLAKKNTVLFVEYPNTYKDLIVSFFGKGNVPVLRMLGIKSRIEDKTTSQGNMVHHLVVPPLLPIQFIKIEFIYNLLYRFNVFIYSQSILRAINRLSMKDPICVSAYNSIYGNKTVGKLGEKLNVYYCYDDTEVMRYGKRAIEAEESLSRRVKGIIVTSEYLANSKYKLNKNVFIVKNGVDVKLFSRMVKTDINRLAIRKLIGYIGCLDHRFDTDTVEYAVKHLPGYNFEFLGLIKNKGIEKVLSKYSNVKFLPPTNPENIPGYLHKYDLGLIPYICNDSNKNIYPLKLNEYLLVGLPVVLTAFADLSEFEEVVRFARDKESFYNAIVSEIETDSEEKIKSRFEFAKYNSWETRAEYFGDILDHLLKI